MKRRILSIAPARGWVAAFHVPPKDRRSPRVDWRTVPVAVFATVQLPDGSHTVTGVLADGTMPALDRAPGFLGFER